MYASLPTERMKAMKKLTLIFALLLTVLLIASCGADGTDGTTTTTDPSAQVSPSEDTTVADTAKEPLSVIANGATEYRVVRSEDSAQAVTEAASKLRLALQDGYGIKNITIGTDFERREADPSERYPYEILVGCTNRDESMAALSSISYNDYIIAVSGSRVVILGGNDAKTAEAVDHFIANYVKGDALSIPADHSYVCAATYPYAVPSVMGVPLNEYTIVTASSCRDMGNIIAAEVGEMCGAMIKVISDSADPVEHEIIIGSTRRAGIKQWTTTDDYTVSAVDGDVCILGGSPYAIGSGCRDLLDIIKQINGADISSELLTKTYTLPDRQTYIDNIDLLPMHWDIYMETPEWMLDFNEKISAMSTPDGRLMSCNHRGDMAYYPENSIEGIISSVKMGADMIEIDPRRTRDGVLVLIHDSTLTRTTNFSDMAGKNGLPTSNLVEDWTYDQLQQLNLKEKTGGTGASVTPYKIPTLEEAMKVCANRLFIRLDVKADDSGKIFWDYTQDIWPLMQKYNTYNIIFTWHSIFTANDYSTVKKYKSLIEQQPNSLNAAVCFVGLNTNNIAGSALSKIEKNGLDNCIRLTNCDFSDIPADDFVEKNKLLLSQLKGKVRVYIDAHGHSSDYETRAYWKMLDDAGINLLLVNRGLDLCKYISETEQPTAY